VIPEWAVNCFVIGDDIRRKMLVLDNLYKFRFKPEIVTPNFFQEWPENFSKKRSLALTRRSLSLGEIGCAKSHIDCYEKFLSNKHPLTLIFEDDAHIAQINFNEFIYALQQIEVMEANSENLGRVYTFFTESAIVKKETTSEPTFFRVLGEPSHGVCYVANRKGAEALISANKNLDFQADWPKSASIKYFLYSNKLISHGETYQIHDSFLDSQRKSLTHSKIKTSYLAIKSIFFVTYILNKQYYKSKNQYLLINVLPILKWRLHRCFSKQLKNWPNGVRIVPW
jgi:GR25 family glycosyltransferase involved in LPS biosynthesis